jgi:hypothetical protein
MLVPYLLRPVPDFYIGIAIHAKVAGVPLYPRKSYRPLVMREDSLRAASMSYTERTRRSTEPGWAEVIPLPKMIDASEPWRSELSLVVLVGDVLDVQAKPQFSSTPRREPPSEISAWRVAMAVGKR